MIYIPETKKWKHLLSPVKRKGVHVRWTFLALIPVTLLNAVSLYAYSRLNGTNFVKSTCVLEVGFSAFLSQLFPKPSE